MNGWTFLAITTAICIGAFLNGLRFARMTKNPWAGKRIGPFPAEGGDMSVGKVRLIGRIQMIAAPIMLLFFVALTLGLLGPVEGIQTIKL